MSAISPSSTVMRPSCSFFDPAISPRSVDFPTTSGPITPTSRPGGMSTEMASSASALPYRWVTASTRTTGWAASPAAVPGVAGVGMFLLGVRGRVGRSGRRAHTGLGLAGAEETALEPVRPHGVVPHLHVADSTDAGLDVLDVVGDQRLGHLDLDAEHELFALALGLDFLGRELRLRGNEADVADRGAAGLVVHRDAPFRADLHLGGLGGGQEDLHIDVFEVD